MMKVFRTLKKVMAFHLLKVSSPNENFHLEVFTVSENVSSVFRSIVRSFELLKNHYQQMKEYKKKFFETSRTFFGFFDEIFGKMFLLQKYLLHEICQLHDNQKCTQQFFFRQICRKMQLIKPNMD